MNRLGFGAASYLLLVSSCSSGGPAADTSRGQAQDSETSDPCDAVDCGEHGICIATEGEASCECDDGYVDDSLTCVDENECAFRRMCPKSVRSILSPVPP